MDFVELLSVFLDADSFDYCSLRQSSVQAGQVTLITLFFISHGLHGLTLLLIIAAKRHKRFLATEDTETTEICSALRSAARPFSRSTLLQKAVTLFAETLKSGFLCVSRAK